MNKRIRVNKYISNCYIYNGSGLLSNRHFIYSAACLLYINPALFHLGAGFFMLKF